MNPDACREWRGALATAALGHLDDAETIALHAHLDGCPSCRAELAELIAVARALPLADPDRVLEDELEPRAGLATDVVERIASQHARVRRRRFARILAVAAAVLLVVVVAAVVARGGGNSTPATRVSFPTSAEASGRAELTSFEAGTQVKLHAGGLDAGDEYWLWLTGDDQKRVAAGTFTGSADGEVEVTLTAALPLADARRIWVTDNTDKVVLDAKI
jgi:anti-sigma factor RsiW